METEFQSIINTLKELNGMFICSKIVDSDEMAVSFELHFWYVNNQPLIVTEFADGNYGLYGFLGKENDCLEKDIELLKSRFAVHI